MKDFIIFSQYYFSIKYNNFLYLYRFQDHLQLLSKLFQIMKNNMYYMHEISDDLYSRHYLFVIRRQKVCPDIYWVMIYDSY